MDAILYTSSAIFWIFIVLCVGCVIGGVIHVCKKEKK